MQIFSPWDLLKTAPAKFVNNFPVNSDMTWVELLKTGRELQEETGRQQTNDNTEDEKKWLESFKIALAKSIIFAEERIAAVEILTEQCNELADVEWDFLYNKSSNLFTIGYNANEHRIDSSFYDLLASEARFVIFIGIAQGKLPEE